MVDTIELTNIQKRILKHYLDGGTNKQEEISSIKWWRVVSQLKEYGLLRSDDNKKKVRFTTLAYILKIEHPNMLLLNCTNTKSVVGGEEQKKKHSTRIKNLMLWIIGVIFFVALIIILGIVVIYIIKFIVGLLLLSFALNKKWSMTSHYRR